MKYSGKVMIEKVTEKTGKTSTRNPKGRDNVNVAQGPRTGNADAHAGKRAEFKSVKESRAPLADVIARAYGARSVKDHVDPKMEGISPDNKPRKIKR